MEAKLIVVDGKASKDSVTLKLPTIIGRSRKAKLSIAHPMVSRRHCELFEADGLLMVRDLGSLNGTVVGGRRIKEAPLPPETKFTVGPLTFLTQYEYAGDLSQLPEPVLDDPGGVQAVAEPPTDGQTVEVTGGGAEPDAALVSDRQVSPAKPKVEPKTEPAPKAPKPPAADADDASLEDFLKGLT
jgi:pSer/pThr/pTyr-binding forkhead associated (FHA) protein